MRVTQSSLIRQSILSTVGVLVQGLARFGYSILIGRAMGPDVLAHINTLISLSILLSLLWPTASGNAAANFLARSVAAGHSPKPVLRLLWQSFALASLVLSAVGIVVMLASGGRPSDILPFVALVIAWSGYILVRGVELGLGRVSLAAFWDVVSAVISIGLLVVVLLGDLSWALLWPLAIGYALFAIAGWVGATRRLDAGVEIGSPRREVLHFIGWNSAGLLATNGLVQFSMVFAYLTSEARDAGMFAAAMALATPASMLAQAVSQALIPRFSEWVHTDRTTATRKYLPVLAAMFGLLALAFGVVALLAPWLVPLLYGTEYGDAVGILRLLLLGVFLFSVGVIASSFLITTGRTVAAAVLAGVGTALGLLAMVVLAPLIGGATAAGWGVVTGAGVTVIGVVILSVRPLAPPVASPSHQI